MTAEFHASGDTKNASPLLDVRTDDEMPPVSDETLVLNRKPLTVLEAVPLLGLSRAGVYALCKAKKIRHHRVGVGKGKILILPDAIQEYLARATVDSTEGAPEASRPGKHEGLKSFLHLNSDRLLASWKKQGKA